jgi:hypothetical protein
MMRARLALVLLLALVAPVAPAPAADPGEPRAAFCAAVTSLIAAARQDFASVKGTQKSGDEPPTWAGTVSVPTTRDCLVYGGKPASYRCALYTGDREGDADVAYRQATDMLRSCVPSGWTVRETADGTRARTASAGGGKDPSVRVVSRIAEGDAYLVNLWVNAPE